MNPGEMPREASEDAELGEALHQRLSQLAARLERLTGGRDTGHIEPESSSAHTRAAPPVTVAAPARQAAPARARSEGPEATSLAEIAAALRDLDREPAVRPVAEPARRPTDQRSAEDKLRAIRQRIDALKARSAVADDADIVESALIPSLDDPEVHIEPPRRNNAAPAPTPAAAEVEPAPPRHSIDFNAAIAEIAERQRLIDRPAEPAPPTRREPLVETPSTDESPLTDAIAELRRKVEELSRAAPTPPTPKPVVEPPPPERVTLRDELLPRHAGPARTRPETRSDEEPAQAAILERLDQFLARAAEPGFDVIAQEILHKVPSGERFDALSAEIDRLSERIATVDPRAELARIDQRLSSFERQFGASGQSESTTRLEAEISGIRDAVESVARMLHNGSSPALVRLEERLNQVSERFEAMVAGAPRADTVTDLLSRLETIAARGESAPAAMETLASEIAELRARERSELQSLDAHIQALAQRLDDTLAGGGASVAELEARFATLAQRLDDLAEADPSVERQAELTQVEDQIAQLSARIDQMDSPGGPEGLEHLESQVNALMTRLNLLAGDHDTLRSIQDNLSRLETAVFDSGSQSLDSIREAARDAVQELSGLTGSKDSSVIEGLKTDLRSLQDAARTNDRQTAETLDAVHETLDRVVARLGSLESEFRSQAPAVASAPAPVAAPARPTADEPKPQARRAERHAPATSDRPLQPGTPRPQPATTTPPSDRDRRADFIAAARRAAQAAAAEHSAMRRVTAESIDEPGEAKAGKGRIRRFVSDHRRPLLLAATAVVLAIAVLQILKPFSGNDTAPAETPAVSAPATPEVSPPAAEATSPAAVTPAAPSTPATTSTAPPSAAATPSPSAFIPPAGVTSPVVSSAVPAAEAPAASAIAAAPVAAAPAAADAAPAEAATTYPMPPEAIGTARLRVAAAAGDPGALYEVGARYAEGRGVDRNMAEAAVWLERAADAGLAIAQHRLATMYEAGLGVAEDRQKAYDWYLAAAQQGNVLAMHNLGVMLSQGIDGTPDFANAIEWFTAAADHGIRDSQYNLGVIYARGIGVAADLVESYKWFALAAAQGDSDAAARRDDIAAALTPDQLTAARAAVSAWQIEGAPAAANTAPEPDGGWDAPDDRAALDQQDLVRTIQNLLTQQGYDPGPADGVVGPQTRDAVRAFQQTIGALPTGEIDQDLLRDLTLAAR